MIKFETLTIDCTDVRKVAEFWRDLLGWEWHEDDDGDLWISDPDKAAGSPDMLFQFSPDPRHGKNRLHWDLRPDNRDAEVERALSLGATHVDIGQTGKETWVVLADPEGNEFCILRATTDPTG